MDSHLFALDPLLRTNSKLFIHDLINSIEQFERFKDVFVFKDSKRFIRKVEILGVVSGLEERNHMMIYYGGSLRVVTI